MGIDPMSAHTPLVLKRLKRMHFYTAENEAFENLLTLLRAPCLLRLDVRLMSARDEAAFLKCGELVRQVIELRVYGVCKAALDVLAMSVIMPNVKVLDMTMADRALARGAGVEGFRWAKLDTLRLRNPRFESVQTILTFIAADHLRIHYPFPARCIDSAEKLWVATQVDDVILTEEGTTAWYEAAR